MHEALIDIVTCLLNPEVGVRIHQLCACGRARLQRLRPPATDCKTMITDPISPSHSRRSVHVISSVVFNRQENILSRTSACAGNRGCAAARAPTGSMASDLRSVCFETAVLRICARQGAPGRCMNTSIQMSACCCRFSARSGHAQCQAGSQDNKSDRLVVDDANTLLANCTPDQLARSHAARPNLRRLAGDPERGADKGCGPIQPKAAATQPDLGDHKSFLQRESRVC